MADAMCVPPQDFKRGSDPSGIISIKDHVVEGAASPLEFGCVGRDSAFYFWSERPLASSRP